MDDLISRILNTSLRRWWWRRPFYAPQRAVTSEQLDALESLYSFRFPADLRQWLERAGCGQLGDGLQLHPPEVIAPVDAAGPLTGYIEFAVNDRGDYYAFAPDGEDDAIYHFSFTPLGYRCVAPSFRALLEQLLAERGVVTCLGGQQPLARLNEDGLWQV